MKRRDFIQNAAIGAVLPSFFGKYNVNALATSPWLNSLMATETDHVLVIVQMFGGNDGLNCVVPVDQYNNLATARSNILIPENKLLQLNGITQTAFNPAMEGMKQLFDEGKMHIVQGVGYPNPTFSHFRSTDIWMSASESTENVYSGWIGRYLQSEYPNYPTNFPNTAVTDPLALQIGAQVSLTLQGVQTPMGMSISTDGVFYDVGDESDLFDVAGYAGVQLAHIRQVAQQTFKYGGVIKAAYNRGENKTTYPSLNPLADQLKMVARLIKGGLKTRVYTVSMDGFDTHADQILTGDVTAGRHFTLLTTLSTAITAFQRDLEQLGLADRVLGMTFSEFGRRIRSNASLGTDHGTSGPMFLFGSRLFGGFTGVNPTIERSPDISANVPMQYDFRSVYASVLKDWFCVDSTTLQTIMLRNFQPLRIVNSPSCITPTTDLGQKDAVLIENYPNPFTFATTIHFHTEGGHTMVQIFDVEGRLVATPINADYVAGAYKVWLNTEGLPTGVYYARLQNGATTQLRAMLKVN